MSENANARIVSYNLYGERVCAAAAKISTTAGNAYELFDGAADSESNRKLIGKVLSSGHSSVVEHAVFSLALKNVSVYVEQFFIEHRLASFTVKSRRYVDFGEQGYYIPPELTSSERERYTRYMDVLFAAYKTLLDGGIPREDARFVLPYSLYSNFYCTLNARELCYIIAQMKSGRGRDIPELRELARQLEQQLYELFPSLEKHVAACERTCAGAESAQSAALGELKLTERADAGKVELLSAPAEPQRIVDAACALQGRTAGDYAALVNAARPRELELLSYTFSVRGVTLSALTHLARHRMQSLIVPELNAISPERVIVPESVRAQETMCAVYTEAVSRAYGELKAHENDALYARYRRYFILSGSMLDVISTMNARELLLFMQLRSCMRAQWEIRDIAVDMLKLLRESFPALFDAMGPSCYVKGYCPEGRLGCGKMEEVRACFAEGTK